jgi:hypothetical protein
MKVRSVGDTFHADGQTMKLIVAFRSFSDVPKR